MPPQRQLIRRSTEMAGAPKPKQRFINDAIRNDFHKKFLSKYCK